MIGSRLKFTVQNLREKLWIKPLGNAVLAVVAVYWRTSADGFRCRTSSPTSALKPSRSYLTVISASMLGVATFAVASMVSAYASAGGSATPRAFALIISDGLSQTALSSFIGAFIFSIVGIIAIKVGYFAIAGRFVLFVLPSRSSPGSSSPSFAGSTTSRDWAGWETQSRKWMRQRVRRFDIGTAPRRWEGDRQQRPGGWGRSLLGRARFHPAHRHRTSRQVGK